LGKLKGKFWTSKSVDFGWPDGMMIFINEGGMTLLSY